MAVLKLPMLKLDAIAGATVATSPSVTLDASANENEPPHDPPLRVVTPLEIVAA
jgi:hypothetical protein